MNRVVTHRPPTAVRKTLELNRVDALSEAFANLQSKFRTVCNSSSGDTISQGKELFRAMARVEIPRLCTFLSEQFVTSEAKAIAQRDFLLSDAVAINALADYIATDPTAPQAKRLCRQLEPAVSESPYVRSVFHRELKTVTHLETTAMARLKRVVLENVEREKVIPSRSSLSRLVLSKLGLFG